MNEQYNLDSDKGSEEGKMTYSVETDRGCGMCGQEDLSSEVTFEPALQCDSF